MLKSIYLFFLLIAPLSASDLIQDLLLVEKINQQLNDQLPLYSNHFLQAGCFNMPSARSFEAGDVAFGFSKVAPYTVWSARAQPFSFLEITGSYRIFDGIPDPVLSSQGFGDFSDKGVNVKIILLRPEEFHYRLPGLAIGIDDFLGTRSFHAQYLVATYGLPCLNMEFSLGYGRKRYKGVFGSVIYSPFRKWDFSYLQSLAIGAEYDATDYKNAKREPHPKGRSVATHWNVGLKYKVWDAIELSLSSLRGKELAFAVNMHASLGSTKGFFPKYKDPLPYQGEVSDNLACTFERQGFFLREMAIEAGILRLRVDNERYSLESVMRHRLHQVLCRALSFDVDSVLVEIESDGIVVREYLFAMSDLERYRDGLMGEYELCVLSPEQEYSKKSCKTLLFVSYCPFWNTILKPKIHNNFGSAKGKYKGALGVQLGGEGFVWNKLYFQLLFGSLLYSDLGCMRGMDRLNPSTLNNVHSDIIRYYKKWGITLDTAYLQSGWDLGCGWYARVSAGCFERAYGGICGELLYYPVNSRFAIGIEASKLYRRTLKGWGFVDKIRKLDGFNPYFRKFHGSQYFLDLYYDVTELQVDIKLSAGKFLADDWGAKIEMSRYFSNGVRMGFWYTYTNGRDRINGEIYHDKGVFLSMPLDFFYCRSNKDRWDYSLAAWLRDVGYRASTGYGLFDIIKMY